MDFADPLFQITSVTDARTGSPLSRITLSEIKYAGTPVSPTTLLYDRTSFGVSAEGDTLACTVPCGFGVTEGRYEFKVTAPGYQPMRVAQDGRYQRLQSECPRVYAGSTELRLSLEPQ